MRCSQLYQAVEFRHKRRGRNWLLNCVYLSVDGRCFQAEPCGMWLVVSPLWTLV